MNIIELIRKKAVCDIFARKTMLDVWQKWQPGIRELLSGPVDAGKVLDVGDHLSDIFRSTSSAGRSQGDLSIGGAAWESLILWYINLCCAGTRMVAIKKKTQVPEPMRKAATVSYGDLPCNTESDITVIVFPDKDIYTDHNEDWIKGNDNIDYDSLSASIEKHFKQFRVGIVQCKTNWNENAQIPMLWDIVYNAGTFREQKISVGKEGFRFVDLADFTYSFVTVPTSNMSRVRPTSTCVSRVKNLSGGNFWGKPSEPGIADSIKEIFRNYAAGYDSGGIRAAINEAIPDFAPGGFYGYFRI